MFNPAQVVDFAKKAMERALSLTEEEGKALLGKLPLEKLGQRTSVEVEKVVSGLVTKLFSGLDEQVDETVRAEVVKMVVEMNTTPRNVVSHLRYVNDLFQATAPKNLKDLKKIRSTIAHRLIEDAKVRLAADGTTTKSESTQAEASVGSKKKNSKAAEKHAE
ncbi:MAG: hypothetical protein FJY29_01800 [Betaproteobacteria bacterium]|nr:hypothetical protein [Betaproteobacteria bacterium]